MPGRYSLPNIIVLQSRANQPVESPKSILWLLRFGAVAQNISPRPPRFYDSLHDLNLGSCSLHPTNLESNS